MVAQGINLLYERDGGAKFKTSHNKASYFIAVFKKKYGTTPKKYLQEIMA